jgi:hypothetical protein
MSAFVALPFVTFSLAAGMLMAFLGLGSGALRLRPGPRRCPTCGLRLSSRTCRRCRRP